MNARQQREALEWFNEWGIPCTRDQLASLSRGPFREVLNFLITRSKTDGFIDTLRTNLYLQEGNESGNKDFMQNEINDALFSEKEAKLRELELKKKKLEEDAKRKQEILHAKINASGTNPTTSLTVKKELCANLNSRALQAEHLIDELEKIKAPKEAQEMKKGEACKKNVEALQQAAHEAFQGMVMRHYLLESQPGTPFSEGGLTVEEFNALVMQVLEDSSCGKCVSDWVRQEREKFVKIVQDQARAFSEQGKNAGFQMSINEKMNKLVKAWSHVQVQAHLKNNAREVALAELEEELRKKQQDCRNNAKIGYRLADYMSLIRCKVLSAQVVRCRQHASGTAKPLETLSRNFTSDCFATPSPDKEIDTLFEFGSEGTMRDWVGAISDLEQMQELYAVLQKTWKSGKLNLAEMLRSAQRPKTELVPSVLQTIETIKLTAPKASSSNSQGGENPNFSYHSDFHSMLTVSMMSNAQSHFDTTIISDSATSSASSTYYASESPKYMDKEDSTEDDVTVPPPDVSSFLHENETIHEAQFPQLAELRKFLDTYKPK